MLGGIKKPDPSKEYTPAPPGLGPAKVRIGWPVWKFHRLGDSKFDKTIGWWEGRVTLSSGSSFVLYVHTPSESDQSITDAARAALERMKSSEAAARQFAADELLAIHREEWSEGKPIGSEEFMRRLSPAAIQVWPDGDAEISFGDDDMFWGHEVGIRYRSGKFTEAVIQG